jgi:hypothetical protein
MKISRRISVETRGGGLLALAATSKTPFRHAELCQKLPAWKVWRIMSEIQGQVWAPRSGVIYEKNRRYRTSKARVGGRLIDTCRSRHVDFQNSSSVEVFGYRSRFFSHVFRASSRYSRLHLSFPLLISDKNLGSTEKPSALR